MKNTLLALVLVLSSVGAFAQNDVVSAVVGTPKSSPISGAALDAKTRDVGSRLRCPVCQGLSIADSPASMAVNMKGEVRELLARGYSDEQVIDYFEHSYGQFVLLDPPRRGINWLVWALPVLLLRAGAFFIRRVLVKGPAEAAPIPLDEDDELAPYIARVRELAYGDREVRALEGEEGVSVHRSVLSAGARAFSGRSSQSRPTRCWAC